MSADNQGAIATDIIDPDLCRSLDELFDQRVRRTPDNPAYHGFCRTRREWQTVNWRQAGEAVAHWRAALAREGLNKGERVGIALKNSREWVYFDQAALSLGLVVVPLYPEDRPDNVAYILNDAQVRLLLVQDIRYWQRLAEQAEKLETLRRVVVVQDFAADSEGEDDGPLAVSDWLDAGAMPLPERNRDPHALATIVYTSGTTGRSKGVMLSHYNILSVAHASLALKNIYPDDVFLSFLPLSHTLERTGGYYLPLICGASVAYARSIQQLSEDLLQVRPTVLVAVPRIFERFYARIQQQLSSRSPIARRLFALTVKIGWHRFERQQGRAAWSPLLLLWPLLENKVATPIIDRLGGRLRFVVSGGAALGAPIARLFVGLGLPVLQGYGLTETSPIISVNIPEDNDPFSVGILIPGVEARIGVDSELLVKSPGLMLGYWRNPEATREVIDQEGWFHTGDQARLENGHVYITGRIKDILVLSNGEKIPPGDMESAITLDGMFEQALIIGEGQAFLSAILVINEAKWPELASEFDLPVDAPASLEDSRLCNHLVNRLGDLLKDFPGFAKVRRVVLSLDTWSVNNGLLTPTLKIRRRQVLDHFAQPVADIYGQGLRSWVA